MNLEMTPAEAANYAAVLDEAGFSAQAESLREFVPGDTITVVPDPDPAPRVETISTFQRDQIAAVLREYGTPDATQAARWVAALKPGDSVQVA